MRGVRGAGERVQEIAQFWPGKARFHARVHGLGSQFVRLLLLIITCKSCQWHVLPTPEVTLRTFEV